MIAGAKRPKEGEETRSSKRRKIDDSSDMEIDEEEIVSDVEMALHGEVPSDGEIKRDGEVPQDVENELDRHGQGAPAGEKPLREVLWCHAERLVGAAPMEYIARASDGLRRRIQRATSKPPEAPQQEPPAAPPQQEPPAAPPQQEPPPNMQTDFMAALGEFSKAIKKVAEEMEQQMQLRRRPWSACAVGTVVVTLAWFIALFWLFWWYYVLTNGGQLTVKEAAYKTATGAAADLTKRVTLGTLETAGSLGLEAMSMGTSAFHSVAGVAFGSRKKVSVVGVAVKVDRKYWKDKGFSDEKIDKMLKYVAEGYIETK